MKAIVFDMDGVLFDTERLLFRAWYDMCKKFAITPEEIHSVRKACAGHNIIFTEKYFTEFFGDRLAFWDFWNGKEARYHELLDELGVPPKEGLYELMEFLKEAGYKIALATSTNREGTMRNLTETDILKYFDVLTTGDMFKHGKPHPEVYLTACELLGADPKETYGVEDSYAGLESAHRAGMKVVMIPDLFPPTDESRANTDFIFPSLTALREYLQKQES